MKKKILIIGSMNTDMVVNTSHLPLPGETVLGGSFMMNSGGKGANQAVAAARLGGDVYFITKSGNDLFGRRAVEQYAEDNIHTEYIFEDANLPSGVALIIVDEHGENSIAVASGANMALSTEDINAAEKIVKECDILLMQLEIPMETVEYAARIAHAEGKTVVLNPAPMHMLTDEFLSNCDIIIPNETEAEILSGIKIEDFDSACRAADAIAERGVPVVIVTLGSKGALIRQDNEYILVEARKVTAVDATAAGDTFCGALCVALSEGKDVREAVEFGCKASALTVSRQGAQMSIPYRDEVDRL